MVICPYCGQPIIGRSNVRMTSNWMRKLHADHALRCFCRTPVAELEKMKVHLEEELSKLVRERFPHAVNMTEILMENDKLEVGDTFRVELNLRMGYLRRLGEFLAQKSVEVEQIHNDMEQEEAQAKEDLIHGRSQSLRHWLRGFR